MRRNDRLHLFDKLSYVCGVIREETVTEQKYCDRYQNTKNVKSIASTVKKAWLRHGALNHWKEIREFFDRKMTDDEFLEWKTNFRMKTKN